MPITLENPNPETDFITIAALMSSVETEPTSPASLLDWYTRWLEKGLRMAVTRSPAGDVTGFHCIYPRGDPDNRSFDFYLVIDPGQRGRGLGQALYLDIMRIANELEARKLFTFTRDNDEHSLGFATRRSFSVRSHALEMALDLTSFDSARFDPLIAALQAQGYRFTNMAELGDGEGERRRLYALNDSTAATTPGSEGEHPWADFEAFNTFVCQSAWYRPEGQVVAIHTASGDWAGMSAITRFEGAGHAYNLFTGVDPAHRGRGLGQAVKVLALRYAARSLDVERVCTNHNALNEPMLAIDRKLGYEFTPGVYGLVREVTRG